MTRLSIIIPTFQRCLAVERALSSLASQTFRLDEAEVIVSIDGSNDGTREAVSRFQAPYALKMLWQPNQGRAAACNAGIHAASGEVVVLLDDDMEATPGFMAGHWEAHQTDRRLGVVGAAPIPLNDSAPPLVQYMGQRFNEHLVKLAAPGYQMTFRDFYSGNFSIRRETLLDVGLFDEAFKVYGNEDGELALRLMDKGVQLVYSPAALAHQHYLKGFAGLARDNISKGQTAVLLAQKRPETYQSLKLSTYHQVSPQWYAVRAALLQISKRWHWLPATLTELMLKLERRRVPGLYSLYFHSLDYFYWLGAQQTQK